MNCKRATLVINPRAGVNLAKTPDILAVLAAADWSTRLAIKEYGGQTLDLATKAADKGSDLVIAYGGDGTLNQVVNGVTNARRQRSIVGLIPGGTANVWAGEINIPGDPMKASLTLVDSDVREVDLGHIEVEKLAFPNGPGGEQQSSDKQSRKKNAKATSRARHHFLLMAGLGIDAAVMGHVSKTSKYEAGKLAVGASAIKELPGQHAFPVEIRVGSGDVLWKGEALQVVIGNSRRYAGVAEMTPNAYIDDGILNICVITGGEPLTTTRQIFSLLLRRKPDNSSAEYFQGAHFSINVPASIALQLDGSAVKLKDYLSKSDRKALAQADDAGQVMVTYRFDAMPHALQVAIPRTYDDALFQESDSANRQQKENTQATTTQQENQQQENEQPELDDTLSHGGQQQTPEYMKALLDNGRKVTVVGVSPNPGKKDAYIVAGTATKQSTGEARPVAVCIDKNTAVMRQTGQDVSQVVVSKLREGETIVVDGKKSKRGVMRARQVVI